MNGASWDRSRTGLTPVLAAGPRGTAELIVKETTGGDRYRVEIPATKQASYDRCDQLFQVFTPLEECPSSFASPAFQAAFRAMKSSDVMQHAREWIGRELGKVYSDSEWSNRLNTIWFQSPLLTRENVRLALIARQGYPVTSSLVVQTYWRLRAINRIRRMNRFGRRFLRLAGHEEECSPLSSGFGHVVIGESNLGGGVLGGFHFWYAYHYEESLRNGDGSGHKSKIKYAGPCYVKSHEHCDVQQSNPLSRQGVQFADMSTLSFTWEYKACGRRTSNFDKRGGSILNGCSLEGLLALGTAAFEMKRSTPSPERIDDITC